MQSAPPGSRASRGIASAAPSNAHLGGDQLGRAPGRTAGRSALARRRRVAPARAHDRRAPARPASSASVSRRLWNASPSGSVHLGRAVPAQLHDPRLDAGHGQRRPQAGRVAAGVEHEVGIGRERVAVRRSRRPSAAATAARPGATSARVTSAPGMRPHR